MFFYLYLYDIDNKLSIQHSCIYTVIFIMIMYTFFKNLYNHAPYLYIFLKLSHNKVYHDYKIYIITVILYICKLILYNHMPYMYCIVIIGCFCITCLLYMLHVYCVFLALMLALCQPLAILKPLRSVLWHIC